MLDYPKYNVFPLAVHLNYFLDKLRGPIKVPSQLGSFYVWAKANKPNVDMRTMKFKACSYHIVKSPKSYPN